MEQLPKIVQRRLQATAKPGVHPDPDLLAAFVEKSLTDRERSQVLQHLADCADCRDVMALAMPEMVSPPSPVLQKSNWLSWPVLRWGALAACVVVVSAAVTLHYQRRQALETYVAEKTPATPASSAEINAPQQPGEKLAAKTGPPEFPRSDRDLGVASKLAKQQEMKMDSTTAVARTGVFALDRDAKDRELNNRLANAGADKSADKPAGYPAMVAAAPAPVQSAKAAPAAPATEARNDNVNAPPSAMAETVTVEGATTSVLATEQTPARKAKDEATRNEARKEVQAAQVAAGAAAVGGRKTDALSTTAELSASSKYAMRSRTANGAPRWMLSADGILQRSFDSGKTWQTIAVASNVVFRALAANDSDIWVGGAAGALYHSSDAGQHWLRVYPAADGQPLTADIATVEFSDAQHGKLTTSTHETWVTSTAGETWQKY